MILQGLKSNLAVKEERLQRAEETNIKVDAYEIAIEKASKVLADIREQTALTEKLLKVSVKLSKQHRDKKIKFLEDEIDKNLSYLLPQEDFRVKITFNDRNGDYTANLEIAKGDAGKQAGNWHSPRAYNGRFIRQMISFSCMYSINKLRGSKAVFSDESLASADKVNLTKLKPLFDSLIDEGFQITIIEHKEELYNTMSRREFHLYKDRELQAVQLKEVKDIEC